MKEQRFEAVADLLKLSQDQFDRMIPDLRAWYAVCRFLEAPGVNVDAFIWVDDGKSGEIAKVDITVQETGDKRTIFEAGGGA